MKKVKTPLARCSICQHRIFSEDKNWESHSFVDSSGNNDRSYKHTKCPKHTMSIIKTIVEKKCNDCGVILEESVR